LILLSELEFFPIESAPIDFTNNILIFQPAVSIGNVGQLAVDLLISSLSLSKVGFIECPFVLPVAGNDTFSENEGKLAVNVEVFQDKDLQLTVVQQRAPIARGQSKDFATNLVSWIISKKFRQVVYLLSADASRRFAESQLSGHQIRYISTLQSGLSPIWKPLEQLSYQTVLKRGGFSSTFLQQSEQQALGFFALILFCAEGDNIPDAIMMCEYLNELLNFQSRGVQKVTWKIPYSWAHIQGPPPDLTLY